VSIFLNTRKKLLSGFNVIVSGTVIKGAGRSRLFGYPTANVAYAGKLDLAPGVYIGQARVLDRTYPCVVCFGAAGKKRFEVHLFGFDGDLLDLEITVELKDQISELIEASNHKELQQKIELDIQKAKALLCLPE
jgi:riboflavin kinase/FMN adenylyltransferase